jgi:hypothetical protein
MAAERPLSNRILAMRVAVNEEATRNAANERSPIHH